MRSVYIEIAIPWVRFEKNSNHVFVYRKFFPQFAVDETLGEPNGQPL